jgi:large subunit ribosomal protein L15
MQLHQIQPKSNKNKKRVGRGGKRGTYSGKGQKGQKSRSGRKIRPAERSLIMRLPKLRGFKNKPMKPKPIVINVGELAEKIKDGIINRDALLKTGLIRKSEKVVKILGGGEVKKAVQVEGLEVSESAKKRIEAAGGSVK